MGSVNVLLLVNNTQYVLMAGLHLHLCGCSKQHYKLVCTLTALNITLVGENCIDVRMPCCWIFAGLAGIDIMRLLLLDSNNRGHPPPGILTPESTVYLRTRSFDLELLFWLRFLEVDSVDFPLYYLPVAFACHLLNNSWFKRYGEINCVRRCNACVQQVDRQDGTWELLKFLQRSMPRTDSGWQYPYTMNLKLDSRDPIDPLVCRAQLPPAFCYDS